jgi:hypothetical protein
MLATDVLGATPDACALLTARDAEVLAAHPLTLAPNSGGVHCRYEGPAGPGELGVEITLRLDPDAAGAHAGFAKWVQPLNVSPPGLTVIRVPHLADEAKVLQSPILSGIYFRKGATLVKILAHPPVSDAAIQVAAATVAGRL